MYFTITVWIIWSFFMVSAMSMIPVTMYNLANYPVLESTGWFGLIALVLAFVAALEGLVTIVLRYYMLIKPTEQGSFSLENTRGRIRFILVNGLNWFIAETVCVYGIFLATIAGRMIFLYVFSVTGLGLLIYHAPLFAPFQNHKQ